MNTIKHITAIIIIFLSFSFTLAQVPNWSLNDCEDVNISMHNELAAGNAVILDFGAMWWGSCNAIAPELQDVWVSFGEGSLKVKVYDFLLDGSSPGQAATCEDHENWASEHDLTFPGFAGIYDTYTDYNNAYGTGSIPLILMFIPNPENPSESTLVYNYSTGLGNMTGDVSNDLSSLLNTFGYWSQGIDEPKQAQSDKKLLKVVDLLGRETLTRVNKPLIYIYSDGSHERKIVFD